MTNWRGPGSSGGTNAQRLRVHRWRDPRLLLGVVLILGATVLGARLAAASDDTVRYWTVRTDVVAGDPVTQDSLVATRVKLSGRAAESYVRTEETFAAPLADLVWAHPVPGGSLVGKSAVATRASTARSELPLTVTEGASPGDLRRGDVVDVWVGPGPGDEPRGKAVRVLESVPVVQPGGDADSSAGSLARTVLVVSMPPGSTNGSSAPSPPATSPWSGCRDVDVVIAAGGEQWEAVAIREVEASTSLRLVRRCVDVADLLAVAHAEVATGAFVTADLAGLDADVVYRLEQSGVRVAAVASDPARCAALGIELLVGLGGLDAVARDAPSVGPDGGSARAAAASAPVVAVWGPAGAPGRSTVALALAAATAARGTDTVLVDADTYGGALGQMLSVLDDVSGLVAACRAANNGRGHEVVDHLIGIDPGLRLMTGLPRADMWPQVRPGALELVLSQVRAATELVVVDCGFCLEPGTGPGAVSRNQSTWQVLEQADSIVVVGRPDPVGLARVVRGLHDLAGTAPGCEPTLVVNMMRPSLGWTEREVDATLRRLTGTAPRLYLPFDASGLDLAAVSGQTPRQAAPASPFVARVEVLATQVLSDVRDEVVLASSAT